MKGIFTKKVLIVISVVSVIVLGAVLIAFTTGNTYYPGLSNPDEVFYQRVDDNGNVLYEITNEEMFETIKSSDGTQQLIYMVDSIILESYIDLVTATEIADKISQLTYGTSDPDVLAEYSDEDKTDLETAFEQSMVLAGFTSHPEDYAKLLVAREKFVLETAKEDEVITGLDVVGAYLSSYYDDIQAIKIRFTSLQDAENVLNKFNLVSVYTDGIREYKGFVYLDEDLEDADENIIEAQISVDTYYFDEDENILDLDGDVVYTMNTSGIYTDIDQVQYRINTSGDLEDYFDVVLIPSTNLFDTLDEAETYKEDNTDYFTVNRVDPDTAEDILVKDSTDAVAYTIDSDGKIWDTTATDVTNTTDLYLNKVFTDIEDVTAATVNNSTELTDEEVLAAFIEMYNYVYSVYRDTLTVGSTVSDLVATDNEDLIYNFEELYADSPAIASYMFDSLFVDYTFYSYSPQPLATSNQTYYYLVYKLDEPVKEDVLEKMFDSIETTISIPTTIASDIELPTESYYESTISWSSSIAEVISYEGVVTNPAAETAVDMIYTITVLDQTRIGTIPVTVLPEGENSTVVDNSETEMTYQEILDDSARYTEIEDNLYTEYVYNSDDDESISTTLNEAREELGFQIHDYYLSLDYANGYSGYEYDGNGDKLNLATLDKTLDSDSPLTITADDFLDYTINHNAALYTVYASQYKEVLASTYYEEVFGTERNLQKNNSDRMEEMFDQITQTKSYYTYLQDLYAQYGLAFTYETFIDYAYNQFGIKSEVALLEYFVRAELQPYLINETNTNVDVVDILYPEVQDYYENYFSLNVTHLLAYIDFDENGKTDNFDDYIDTLSQVEVDAFNSLLSRLENAIDVYTGSFSELIAEYNDATRDDATWGEFKQNGFLMLTEDLNQTDDEGNSHSLTYSGEYGVKDSYVQEYVDALIALYQEYQLPQNADLAELQSGLVKTEFGSHIILVTQGDDFDKPTFEFTEEDSSNPVYSVGVENANGLPTVEQLELYSLYKFYAMVHDLTQVDVEDTYNIDVPSFPDSLSLAFSAYYEELISSTYVLGVININLADKLVDGEFVDSSYLTVENAVLMSSLGDIEEIYYDAIFNQYE